MVNFDINQYKDNFKKNMQIPARRNWLSLLLLSMGMLSLLCSIFNNNTILIRAFYFILFLVLIIAGFCLSKREIMSELVDYWNVKNDILILLSFYALIIILLIYIMNLSQNVRDTLTLDRGNFSIWQVYTNHFVHADTDHLNTNIASLIFFIIPQILLIAKLKERKSYQKLLLITFILLPLIASIQFLITETNIQSALGFSIISFAIAGFCYPIVLLFFTKIVKRNLLNILWLVLSLFYVVIYSCIYLIIKTNTNLQNEHILIITFIITIIMLYLLYKKLFDKNERDAVLNSQDKMYIKKEFENNIITYVIIGLLIFIVITIPIANFYIDFVKFYQEKHEIIGITGHMTGLVFGIIAGFLLYGYKDIKDQMIKDLHKYLDRINNIKKSLHIK
jgi:membrane associated rhomboid family serine protease